LNRVREESTPAPDGTGSKLVRVDHLAVGPVGQVLINLGTDARLDEPDRAIAEDEVAATWMPAAEPAHELRFSQLRQARGLARGDGHGGAVGHVFIAHRAVEK